MDINLSISAASGIVSNYLVAAVYESTSPTVAAAYQAIAAPHTAPVNISFTGLNSVVHIFILWENTTNVPGGTVRSTFIYDPSYQNKSVTVRADLVLKPGATGVDPVVGSTSFVRADLVDWAYTVERRGTGSMIVGTDVAINPTGFTLLGVGDQFNAEDIFILHFTPQVNSISPITPTSSGKLFSDALILTANTTLDSSAQGKVHIIQSLTNKITINLPALSAIIDNRIIALVSEGGSHINASIIANGADAFNFLNGTPQSVIMGQSEQLWIFKANGVWNIGQAQGNYKSVGEIVSSYKKTAEGCIMADGSLLSRTTYPRLWAFVQSLDAACICNDTDWNNTVLNYKGRFSTGDGSTTFRLPQLTTNGFLRGVDGSARMAASYQAGSVGPHTHNFYRPRTDTIGTRYEANSMRGGGDRGLWTGDAIATDVNSGAETIPANVGVYFLIKI